MNLKTLIDQLLFEEEGNTLDFKSEQYRFSMANDEDKSELLKDIIAFANAWRRTDAYILIGVKEVKGGRSEVVGISEHIEDSHLQQFINSKTQRPIDFSYKAIQYESAQIGVIHIPVQRRPFYLKKDFGRLKKSQVYIRRGSSTDVASIDEISTMGTEANDAYQDAPSLDAFLITGKHDEIVEKNITCKLINADIPDDEEFPEYGVNYISIGPSLKTSIPNFSVNRNYYKDKAKYLKAYLRVRAFKLGIKNNGTVPARDVKVIFNILNEENTFTVCMLDDLPDKPSNSALSFPHIQNVHGTVPDVAVKNMLQGWRVTCHLGKIQPKDMAITKDGFCLGSNTSKLLQIAAQVFSDDLPEPMQELFEVVFDVEDREYSVGDFLPKEED